MLNRKRQLKKNLSVCGWESLCVLRDMAEGRIQCRTKGEHHLGNLLPFQTIYYTENFTA